MEPLGCSRVLVKLAMWQFDRGHHIVRLCMRAHDQIDNQIQNMTSANRSHSPEVDLHDGRTQTAQGDIHVDTLATCHLGCS